MPRAILLKTKSSPTDPYDIAFREKTPFIPIFVPVLTHQRVNESELRTLLQNEPHQHYIALIITSQRAVEALDDAMSCLTDEQLRQLRGMTVYTVGPATARALTKLRFSTIMGADTGNGGALANLLIQTFQRDGSFTTNGANESAELPRPPLLFLAGDKRRDIIPKRLAADNIRLEELIIYETTVASTFDEELDRVLEDETDGDIEWIVFFSPSGAEVALEKLKRSNRKVKIATIGPTTEEYLRKEWSLIPDMVSAKPEPISMVRGILEHTSPL